MMFLDTYIVYRINCIQSFVLVLDMGKLLIAIEEAEDLLTILQTQPCKVGNKLSCLRNELQFFS